MAKQGKTKRRNTYFRQTAKAFRAARQTQVFSYLKRRIPYTVYTYSRKLATKNYDKLNNLFKKSTKSQLKSKK